MSIQVLETQAEELWADAVLRWSSSNKWWCFVCVCLFCFVCLFGLFVCLAVVFFFLSFIWVCLSEFNLSLLKGIIFSLCCFWSFFVFQCPYFADVCREPTPWGKHKVWLSWWPLIGPHRWAMGGDVCLPSNRSRWGFFRRSPDIFPGIWIYPFWVSLIHMKP